MEKSMTETMKFSMLGCSDVLTEILREGAQRLLSQAVQMEAEAWIAARADQVDAQGHRLVVRNGYLPEREVMTGIGMVPVRQPRVRDRRPVGQREAFDRKILPRAPAFGGQHTTAATPTHSARPEVTWTPTNG